jgi:hypothetical protein
MTGKREQSQEPSSRSFSAARESAAPAVPMVMVLTGKGSAAITSIRPESLRRHAEKSVTSKTCDDFDTKPIDFDRLLQKIEAVLARKNSG